MAIWQYKIDVLPRDAILKVFGTQPNTVSEKEMSENSWWELAEPIPALPSWISEILAETTSWSNEIRMWGEQYGNRISVVYTNPTKDGIEWVSCEIDARFGFTDFVIDLCKLLERIDGLFLNMHGRIINPVVAEIRQDIQSSKAFRYVLDPQSALKNDPTE